MCLHACVRAGRTSIYEGLIRVSRRRHTLTCSPFSQYLIVFLLVAQHQRIGEFMVMAVGHIYVLRMDAISNCAKYLATTRHIANSQFFFSLLLFD